MVGRWKVISQRNHWQGGCRSSCKENSKAQIRSGGVTLLDNLFLEPLYSCDQLQLAWLLTIEKCNAKENGSLFFLSFLYIKAIRANIGSWNSAPQIAWTWILVVACPKYDKHLLCVVQTMQVFAQSNKLSFCIFIYTVKRQSLPLPFNPDGRTSSTCRSWHLFLKCTKSYFQKMQLIMRL